MSVITIKTKTKYGSIYKRSDSKFWQLYTYIKDRPFRRSTHIAIEKDPEGVMALEVLNNFVKMNYYVSKKHKSVNSLAKDFIKTLADINNQTYNVITLHTAISTYLNSLHISIGTSKMYRTALNEFQKLIKEDVELDTIDTQDITKYRDYLIKKNLNTNTVNHKINYLNIFFNHCIKEGYITESPCKRVTKLETISDRNNIRPFTQDELKTLLYHVKNTDWETAVLIGLYTGARIQTVFNILWKDIDFSNNTITIFEKKNHKVITNYLHPQLRKHLLSLDRKTDRVFANVKKFDENISTKFTKILIKAGLIHPKEKSKGHRKDRYQICFHSLRHNFSTMLAENPDISPETRLSLVGHSSLEMNSRYNQISNAAKTAAINSLPTIEY